MSVQKQGVSRRVFLSSAVAAGAGLAALESAHAYKPQADLADDDGKALITITLDIEMSRHYPTWDNTEWDFQKGNLNEPTKEYSRRACQIVKEKGGVLHGFLVGKALEQKDCGWIEEIIAQGHPVGNHTYDHVSVWTNSPKCQYIFQRAPWLVERKTGPQVIKHNIEVTTRAMKSRLGIEPVGFRTPGGSSNGLRDRPDVQKMILDCGFTWVSSQTGGASFSLENPSENDFKRIAEGQENSQPFVYPSGLLEVPMHHPSDVGAFRRRPKRWELNEYLRMIEVCVQWAIDNRAVFDLLTHPSLMYVEDPKFKAFTLICDMVNASTREKGISPIYRNGPEGAAHKLDLSPFPVPVPTSLDRV